MSASCLHSAGGPDTAQGNEVEVREGGGSIWGTKLSSCTEVGTGSSLGSSFQNIPHGRISVSSPSMHISLREIAAEVARSR